MQRTPPLLLLLVTSLTSLRSQVQATPAGNGYQSKKWRLPNWVRTTYSSLYIQIIPKNLPKNNINQYRIVLLTRATSDDVIH